MGSVINRLVSQANGFCIQVQTAVGWSRPVKMLPARLPPLPASEPGPRRLTSFCRETSKAEHQSDQYARPLEIVSDCAHTFLRAAVSRLATQAEQPATKNNTESVSRFEYGRRPVSCDAMRFVATDRLALHMKSCGDRPRKAHHSLVGEPREWWLSRTNLARPVVSSR